MKIEYIKIEELKNYENNPRKNEKAVEIVAKSIKEFGFRNPILIDKENIIIAGHTRLKAAKELGIKKVPTIRIENLSKEQIKAFRIMDNKSNEFAEWDWVFLKEEFMELDEAEYDLEMTGFDLRSVGDILDDSISEDNIEQVNQLGKHQITCPKCKHKFERKDGK